jgi:hypothetical protein
MLFARVSVDGIGLERIGRWFGQNRRSRHRSEIGFHELVSIGLRTNPPSVNNVVETWSTETTYKCPLIRIILATWNGTDTTTSKLVFL